MFLVKQNKHKIQIAISDFEIKLLKAGDRVHWRTRIDGGLYSIEAFYRPDKIPRKV